MIEVVVALLMIVNGEIKEHRIQDSMSTCLKAKRVAMRSGTSRIDYQCIKSKAETEIYMGEKSIVKLILKQYKRIRRIIIMKIQEHVTHFVKEHKKAIATAVVILIIAIII